MTQSIAGVHHVTAIASDPQRNLDFYTQVMGMRLVKCTVNFDDPGTYHFYFGDELGRPGSLLTFFPWPGARRGQAGAGLAEAIAFAVPPGSLDSWRARFGAHRVLAAPGSSPQGEGILAFQDPDGLALELIEDAGVAAREPWRRGGIAPEHALRGFHSVRLAERELGPTARLLTEVMGFRRSNESPGRMSFASASGEPGALVDLVAREGPAGRMGAGIVHHVAWRAADDEVQRSWQRALRDQGLGVTEVIDRIYFHSIYFHEPGGVLFEIATDSPGMSVDETPEELGSRLELPPWLEPMRARIEALLPALRIPAGKALA